mmetsp:Transcript_5546/g.12447  ORF Transcript_5546/g.12447 Transcript_5546/m.12447 type:complete len:466 (+) Transcript_5546:90-1487(+)
MGALMSAPLGVCGSCAASMAGYLACSGCSSLARGIASSSARFAYCAYFTLSMLIAWLLRDFGDSLLKKIPWIENVLPATASADVEHAYFGTQAVYRVSLGTTAFFMLLSIGTVNIKYRSDTRDRLVHHGSWAVKTFVYLLLIVLAFCLPHGFSAPYAWLARLGSVFFLLVQVVILIDFAHAWNDSWVARSEESQTWIGALLTCTAISYGSAIAFNAVGWAWFHPSVECRLNALFLVTGILAALAVGVSAMHPSVSGSIFPASLIAVYANFMIWSALVSEPHSYECNGMGEQLDAASGSALATGVAATLGSVVWAALRAGSRSDDNAGGSDYGAGERERLLASVVDDDTTHTSAGLDGAPDAPDAETAMERSSGDAEGTNGAAGSAADDFDPPSYNYSWFHLVFACASLYVGMLFTGWGEEGAEGEGGFVDVGWVSVWVKVVTAWVGSLLYMWTLVAPMVLSEREF